MKKLTSRFLIVLLILSLTCAMLGGCGTNNAASTAASTPETASEPAAPAEEAAPSAPEAPEEAAPAPEAPEEAEETVERVSYTLPLFDETESFSFWCTYRTATEARSELLWWSQMEEAVNLDIDWVESSEDAAAETYSLMVAADSLTDVVWEANANAQSGTANSAYSGGLDKAVEDGIYLELTDILQEKLPNYYSYLVEYPQLKKELTTDEGRIIVAAQIQESGNYTQSGAFILESLLADAGVDMPATVGDWYEFWTLCRDKELVEVPSRFITGEWNPGFGVDLASAFGCTDNSTFLVDTTNDTVFYSQTSDEFRAYLEFVNLCYDEGLIHKDFYSLPSDMSDIFAGRFGTFRSMVSFVSTQLEGYIAAPTPTYEESGIDGLVVTEYESMLYDDSPCCWLAISAGTQKLDTICTWVDYMYSEEGTMRANYGYDEGVSYEIVDGEVQFTDIMSDRDPDKDIQYVRDLTCYEGPIFTIANKDYAIATDVAKEMYAVINNDADKNAIYSTMPNISLTVKEAETIAAPLTDMETYVAEMILQFETGAVELTDESWNQYVETVNSFGLETVTEVYQAAYDRFVAR